MSAYHKDKFPTFLGAEYGLLTKCGQCDVSGSDMSNFQVRSETKKHEFCSSFSLSADWNANVMAGASAAILYPRYKMLVKGFRVTLPGLDCL